MQDDQRFESAFRRAMAGTHWVASSRGGIRFVFSPFGLLTEEIMQCQCLLAELGDSASLTTDRRASKSQASANQVGLVRLPVEIRSCYGSSDISLVHSGSVQARGCGCARFQRPVAKREFGDMIPERCFGDDKEIARQR